MPLSDDQLSDIEAQYDVFLVAAFRDPQKGVDKAIELTTLALPKVLRELRAARKVVEATRTLVDYLPRVVWEEYRRHNEEAYYLDELKAVEVAVTEYDALSTPAPTSHPSEA